MGISKTGCSHSVTKKDLDNAYKQGFAECVEIMASAKKRAFLDGIEASKTIDWTNESEDIQRVLREWGYCDQIL